MPSTVIRAFDYDASAEALNITFVTGRHYRYHAVPQRIADGIRSAASKGRYFNSRIRDRFAFTRLDDLDD